DFQTVRDSIAKLREIAAELLAADKTFKAVLPLFGSPADQGVPTALMLDTRFQGFLFEQTAMQNGVTREDREQFQLLARRLREFAVLNQLRRGITWMSVLHDGHIVSTDKRS